MGSQRFYRNYDSNYPGEEYISLLLSRMENPGFNAKDIPASDYAGAWSSTLTLDSNGLLSREERELLRHVNCGYLSSGKPPTLLALKQHAQSLAILIRKITTSTTFGIPNAMAMADVAEGEEDGGMWFEENEAFDWLNDLGEPYTNDDYFHNVPLFALHNTVQWDDDVQGSTAKCPRSQAKWLAGGLEDPEACRLPTATHHALAEHASECLELLDHEFSATGGLLSMLPSSSSINDGSGSNVMANARNTFLGKWLLHQQHLVGRMHELEVSYAHALDLLAGEAVVPLQLLSKAGVGTRAVNGEDTAYPQDKYILMNTGDDATAALHALLDEEELHVQRGDETWRSRGVSGDRMQVNDEVTRGLVWTEARSRFYRIKGHGHQSPIFVQPAVMGSDKHIEGGVTGGSRQDMVKKMDTIVKGLSALNPSRVTELEERLRGQVEDEVERVRAGEQLLRDEGTMLRKRVLELELQVRRLEREGQGDGTVRRT